MSLKDKNVVVTGGSRGLGLGLVEALVAHGARVTVVARDADALESVRARLAVATISADVTDETAAHRILAEVRPDILALNAGTTPRMGRLDQLSWADFTAPWETDVKAGLYWLQAALNLPLKPGSRVLVGSSGPGLARDQAAHARDRQRAAPVRLSPHWLDAGAGGNGGEPQEAQPALSGGRSCREALAGPQTRDRNAKAVAHPRCPFAALEPRLSLRRVRRRSQVPHPRGHR